MSTTAALSERTVRAVLLALWQGGDGGVGGAPCGEVTIQQLLQKTLAPLPDIQQSLDQLAARGCRIERTAGLPATVRLVSTGIGCWPDVLQHQAVRDRLSLGRRAMAFQRTPSTNDMAWQAGDAPENHGLVVVADEQSAGRGRRGNSWLAKAQQSVLMSILLVDQSGAAACNIDRLTLLAGLAAATAIETAAAWEGAAVHIQIKWPNDLLIDHRKVAGILVERRGHATVIGIGINVAQGQGDFPIDLQARATSLYQATGVLMDRLRVAAAVARSLDRHFAEGTAPREEMWLDDWKGRCHMLGQRLRVRSDNRIIEGLVVDVHPLQGLLLRDDTGATHFLSAQTATVEVP